MPALLDYIDLRLAVSEFVDRRDISDVFPRFVLNAETKLNRFLRTHEMLTVGAVLSFTAGIAPLPADLVEIKTIWDATNRLPLTGADSSQVVQGTNDLYTYAISGANVIIDGLTGTRLLDYYAALPTLTTSMTTTNWLLSDAPDVYLYAVSVEVAKWLKDKALADAAQNLLDQEILALNRANARERYGNVRIRTRAPTP